MKGCGCSICFGGHEILAVDFTPILMEGYCIFSGWVGRCYSSYADLDPILSVRARNAHQAQSSHEDGGQRWMVVRWSAANEDGGQRWRWRTSTPCSEKEDCQQQRWTAMGEGFDRRFGIA
ncbi:hypothetical protein Vadar_000431 [Vaccinium darrowii]|uniref:Uncharacterized protein n=1 Tax=Vaccinium darrowii TaxID=229202 RepID=A0ACB7Z8R7_9ERIC|nr:hypothetical protein Vadar_000431 [Vaccinium darrowii]